MRISALPYTIWRSYDVIRPRLKHIDSCRVKANGNVICGNPYHVELVERMPRRRGDPCVVRGCTNRRGVQGTAEAMGISFFTVPRKEKDLVRYNKFIWAADRFDLVEFGPRHVVCSEHFSSADIITESVCDLDLRVFNWLRPRARISIKFPFFNSVVTFEFWSLHSYVLMSFIVFRNIAKIALTCKFCLLPFRFFIHISYFVFIFLIFLAPSSVFVSFFLFSITASYSFEFLLCYAWAIGWCLMKFQCRRMCRFFFTFKNVQLTSRYSSFKLLGV